MMSYQLGERNERYADSIINNPSAPAYCAIEVHGVRNLNAPGDPEGTEIVVDDLAPEFFSVYVRSSQGELACVGDFDHGDMASDYAQEIHEEYGWRVSNFVPGREDFKKTPAGVLLMLKAALHILRSVDCEIKRAAEFKERGECYHPCPFINDSGSVVQARKVVADFRSRAQYMGVDAEALITYLGGEVKVDLSDPANPWWDSERRTVSKAPRGDLKHNGNPT